MISIEVSIPPGLIRQLDPVRVDRALATSTRAIGELVRGKLIHYPGPAHSPVIWSSARQRRAYFAKRREAGLDARYFQQSDAMSQRLKLGWVVVRSGTVDTIVRTRVAYARYVQAAQYQTAQHKATGWVTDIQALEAVQRSGDIPRITEQAARKELGV